MFPRVNLIFPEIFQGPNCRNSLQKNQNTLQMLEKAKNAVGDIPSMLQHAQKSPKHMLRLVAQVAELVLRCAATAGASRERKKPFSNPTR